jgi:hypothetical protein
MSMIATEDIGQAQLRKLFFDEFFEELDTQEAAKVLEQLKLGLDLAYEATFARTSD